MPDLPHIRPAGPQDRQALFSICVKTADSGVDASALYSDPDYPGLVWSVPYLEFCPQHCFVVDEGGTAVGFVVGTADTAAYERRLDEEWWPALRPLYANRQAIAKLDHAVLDRIASPKHSAPDLIERFPAHLHINLLPLVQSGGWGRKLIEAELDSLRRAHAPAVHLGVSPTNQRAIGFYRHVGFEQIPRSDGVWFGMTL
jgi:ribosomal protein S18 acetylase RimI-like enzyme